MQATTLALRFREEKSQPLRMTSGGKGCKRPQRAAGGRRLIQIEIANGLASGSILGLFHGFFELFLQDVFLVSFLKPGVSKLILALFFLLFQNAGSLGEVHVRSGLYRSGVR